MKKMLTSLILATAGLNASAQISWTSPVVVANLGSNSNLHPRVAINRSGNPMVLWGSSASNRVYFSRYTGSSFTTPVALNGSMTVFAASWAGPDLASYGDTVYATMKVSPETSMTNYTYLVHSFDGGMTFSAPVRIDNIDTSLSRFPIVTTTANGSPLISFMKFNSMFNDAKYVVVRSSDYGTTFGGFTADVLASGTTGDVCDCCPATLISSGSTVVMLYRNNLSNIREMWAGVSTDGGATFPSNMKVDTTNWMVMSCPSSGPDGFLVGDSLYTVFRSSASGTPLVYFSRSSISASSVSHTRLTGTFTGLLSQDFPRIANSGNKATVVFKQNTSFGNAIVYSFANNISGGFSTFDTVASGSGLANADVTMAPGVVHIVWEDDVTGKVMYRKGTYATTDVASLPAKELINLYPNPANDQVTINLNSINNVTACYLTDNTGKRTPLKPQISGNKATCSLTGIAKGAYYFVINDETGKTFYSKLIIQ